MGKHVVYGIEKSPFKHENAVFTVNQEY